MPSIINLIFAVTVDLKYNNEHLTNALLGHTGSDDL